MNPVPVRTVVTRRFNASAGRVFDAWLDPVWIARWMLGPDLRNDEIMRLRCDPRVGGEFSLVVNRGGTEIEHVGKYLEIDRPGCLVFTWTTSSWVVVEIASLDPDSCELTLTHVTNPGGTGSVERTDGSWPRMLDGLAGVFGRPEASGQA